MLKYDCSVYVTNTAPFYGKEFLKVDYENCEGEDHCPIVFDRTNIGIFWMNHDPTKFFDLRFTISNYIET